MQPLFLACACAPLARRRADAARAARRAPRAAGLRRPHLPATVARRLRGPPSRRRRTLQGHGRDLLHAAADAICLGQGDAGSEQFDARPPEDAVLSAQYAAPRSAGVAAVAARALGASADALSPRARAAQSSTCRRTTLGCRCSRRIRSSRSPAPSGSSVRARRTLPSPLLRRMHTAQAQGRSRPGSGASAGRPMRACVLAAPPQTGTAMGTSNRRRSKR